MRHRVVALSYFLLKLSFQFQLPFLILYPLSVIRVVIHCTCARTYNVFQVPQPLAFRRNHKSSTNILYEYLYFRSTYSFGRIRAYFQIETENYPTYTIIILLYLYVHVYSLKQNFLYFWPLPTYIRLEKIHVEWKECLQNIDIVIRVRNDWKIKIGRRMVIGYHPRPPPSPSMSLWRYKNYIFQS